MVGTTPGVISSRRPRSVAGAEGICAGLRNFAGKLCVVLWYAVLPLKGLAMRAISAFDSVSPAIQRTRDFLFRPFNWGTYLKLCLVAIITEGLGSSLNSSSHNGQSGGHGPDLPYPFHDAQAWIMGFFALALVAVFLSWIFYLVTRLRFAYFHCLINNTREIRPGWWLYREQATRFFWMSLGVGFCFLLVTVLAALPFVGGFTRLFRQMQHGGQPDMGLLLSTVLPLIPIFTLLVVGVVLADLVLRDFMLPHYALENATAGEAWARVSAMIRAEKRQFVAYALLRVVLPAIAVACLFMVLIIPGLFLAGSLAAVEFGIHSVFADATGVPALIGKLLMVFFGVIFFGFAVLAAVCLGGPISTVVREYALIFYGGRYRALGERLYPLISRSA